MAVSGAFLEFAKETFEPFGAIQARKMFGGAGLYCDDLFFAIIAGDAVYFKADDATRSEFENAGLEAFTYEMRDGSLASMSYYGAPDDIYDDGDALKRWTTLALDAASRAAKLKKKPAKKKKR
jgi:DNA transformation protein